MDKSRNKNKKKKMNVNSENTKKNKLSTENINYINIYICLNIQTI